MLWTVVLFVGCSWMQEESLECGFVVTSRRAGQEVTGLLAMRRRKPLVWQSIAITVRSRLCVLVYFRLPSYLMQPINSLSEEVCLPSLLPRPVWTRPRESTQSRRSVGTGRVDLRLHLEFRIQILLKFAIQTHLGLNRSVAILTGFVWY